jgi:XTP/dITP diphosphohydrolase
LAELELMYGSWDPPGARLLDAVAVMDRLASPAAIRGSGSRPCQPGAVPARGELRGVRRDHAGDLDALREELGDVLLQIVLHARLAEDLPEDRRWNVDDVAGGLVDKMVRRNPHVFAGAEVDGVDAITENWERIKQAEKSRDSALEGVALSQPALALAAEFLRRAVAGGRGRAAAVRG